MLSFSDVMKIFHYIFPLVLWLPLLLAAGGCGSRSSEPEIEDPFPRGPKIFVTFNVAVQRTPEGSTRAGDTDLKTWEDTPLDREEGDEFDCRILRNNFSAVLYKNDNSFAGTIRQLTATRAETSFSTYLLSFTGLLDTDITDAEFSASREGDFKIMVFANLPSAFEPSLTRDDNEPDEAGAADADTPDNLTFSRKGKASDFDAIPLWGVKEVTMNNLTSSESYDESKVNNLGTIYLLRAMAMVRVMLGDEVKQRGVELLQLDMSRHNESGYTLPFGWDETSDTKSIRLEKTLRDKADSKTVPGMTIVANNDDEKSKIQFYLPEIANTADDEEVILTVAYRLDGEERQGIIKFREYEDGKPIDGLDPYDIVRNHIYEFVINKVSDKEIQLNAAVRDWRIKRYEYEY